MIPKSEARAAAEAAALDAADILDTKIDDAIRKASPGDAVHVDISNFPAVAVDIVKRRFIEGGWDVQVTHDQRDGSLITLR